MTRRFWLRPKWVVGHLLCLSLIVLFVNLGFWQLRRLHERRAQNKVLKANYTLPVTTIEDARGTEFRRVRITGTYDASQVVLVRSRSLNSFPGDDVLTPLRANGLTVIVNRGFAAIGGGDMRGAVQPTTATVTVEGVLRRTETKGTLGPTDPPTGRLDTVNRIDVARLQQQLPYPVVPGVYVQLQTSSPAESDAVKPIPLPPTTDGPHLSYAIQWFIFATIGAVGWPVLLWRKSREPDDEGAVEPVG